MNELHRNATLAALNHYIGYLSGRLARHQAEPTSPDRDFAIETVGAMQKTAVAARNELVREVAEPAEPDWTLAAGDHHVGIGR